MVSDCFHYRTSKRKVTRNDNNDNLNEIRLIFENKIDKMSTPCVEIIDDIEDLISSQDITPKERYSTRKKVTIRSKPKKIDEKLSEISEAPILSSIIPGTQCIYVKTWGCTHNSSDSEYMAGQLVAYGYNLTDDKNQADLWLLNSCTVKAPAEDHFRNEIEAGKKMGKHVVLAG